MAANILFNSSKNCPSASLPRKSSITFAIPCASLQVLPLVQNDPIQLKIKSKLPLKCHPKVDFIRDEAHAWLRSYITIPQLEAADVPFLVTSMMFAGDVNIAIHCVKFFIFLVFLDDLMDNSEESLNEESISRQEIFQHIIDVMNGKASKLHVTSFPVLQGWNDICHDLREDTTSSLQWKRFVDGMTTYLQGLDEHSQLKIIPSSPCPMLSTYTNIRRKVIGGFPSFPLEHVALGLDIENDLWNHKSFQNLHNLIMDHMVFTNDLVSFQEDEGLLWNVVSILQETSNSSLKDALALSCQKAEEIEKEFQYELHKFKFLLRDRPLLLTYLDLLAAHIPGHMRWLSRSSKYGNRKCHLIIDEDNTPTLQLKCTA